MYNSREYNGFQRDDRMKKLSKKNLLLIEVLLIILVFSIFWNSNEETVEDEVILGEKKY